MNDLLNEVRSKTAKGVKSKELLEHILNVKSQDE